MREVKVHMESIGANTGMYPEIFNSRQYGIASAETSRSSMKLIKTRLRNRISDEVLELVTVDFHKVQNVLKEKNHRIEL